jgi:hypothetical protein
MSQHASVQQATSSSLVSSLSNETIGSTYSLRPLQGCQCCCGAVCESASCRWQQRQVSACLHGWMCIQAVSMLPRRQQALTRSSTAPAGTCAPPDPPHRSLSGTLRTPGMQKSHISAAGVSSGHQWQYSKQQKKVQQRVHAPGGRTHER